MEAVTYPVRVLAAAGVQNLVLTNAAGGISAKLRPGDLMCFSDHINFMGCNPLRGSETFGKDRFVDLSETYSAALRSLLKKAARQAQARLLTGVYLAVSGPSYETPAEIRAFRTLGADAVGMSTVPEAIVARQCGMNVAALSCITNLAAGRVKKPITHAEVLAMGWQSRERIRRVLLNFVRLYADRKSSP
jgi:purine-nucleoside phosphorylase